MKEYAFTSSIKEILKSHFREKVEDIYDKSPLLQYVNEKTKSANRGSKSRSSFANLYAIYVLVEDYLNQTTNNGIEYSKYEGALFSDLIKRQRELPFGEKLQNHALNNRVNAEFQKFFPTTNLIPIIRDLKAKRYWINENLLRVRLGHHTYNIAESLIEILDKYIEVKQQTLKQFIEQCSRLQAMERLGAEDIYAFISNLLSPKLDARLFEIVSYAILKYSYKEQTIIWGYDIKTLTKEPLTLYKTGRTNANDGGIDFVMKPLGRFFQVTEDLDFKKFFLDIEKVRHYPLSFVVKTEKTIPWILSELREKALDTYGIERVVEEFMTCIEEVINIPTLLDCLTQVIDKDGGKNLLEEIILQSKVEFNYSDDD